MPAIFVGFPILAACAVGTIGGIIYLIVKKIAPDYKGSWEHTPLSTNEMSLSQPESEIRAESQADKEQRQEERAENQMFDKALSLWEKAASGVPVWRSNHPLESQQVDTTVEISVRRGVEKDGGVRVDDDRFSYLDTARSTIDEYISSETQRLSNIAVVKKILVEEFKVDLSPSQLEEVRREIERKLRTSS